MTRWKLHFQHGHIHANASVTYEKKIKAWADLKHQISITKYEND